VGKPAVSHEEILVTRAQQGDRRAFGELVGIHYPGVIQVVYHLAAPASLPTSGDAAQLAVPHRRKCRTGYAPPGGENHLGASR
jgi:hypothetical protein